MKLSTKFFWITFFSIAMGYMETAIVVYLRKIYYPGGFQFPLVPITPDIALTEFLREAATIIMLLSIGIITGKTASQKFAWFIYSFGVWDIFYYIFLKILLNWPESIFTWDILFLIPVPWVGPVLAPCIVSSMMIALALCIIYFSEKGNDTKLKALEWISLITGSLLVILSFMWDYFKYATHENALNQVWTLSESAEKLDKVLTYIPGDYNWWIFSVGTFLIIFTMTKFVKRIKSE